MWVAPADGEAREALVVLLRVRAHLHRRARAHEVGDGLHCLEPEPAVGERLRREYC